MYFVELLTSWTSWLTYLFLAAQPAQLLCAYMLVVLQAKCLPKGTFWWCMLTLTNKGQEGLIWWCAVGFLRHGHCVVFHRCTALTGMHMSGLLCCMATMFSFRDVTSLMLHIPDRLLLVTSKAYIIIFVELLRN